MSGVPGRADETRMERAQRLAEDRDGDAILLMNAARGEIFPGTICRCSCARTETEAVRI